MAIKTCAENVIVVGLPPLPQAIDELNAVMEAACARRDCDVVIDLSRLEMVTSHCVGTLLALRALLTQLQRRLILYGICPEVLRVFELMGLNKILEFAPDKPTALQDLQAPHGMS
jgi:anti-anti-sigma factor